VNFPTALQASHPLLFFPFFFFIIHSIKCIHLCLCCHHRLLPPLPGVSEGVVSAPGTDAYFTEQQGAGEVRLSRQHRSGSALTNENDTRASQWTDWAMDEPTILEAQEEITASIEATDNGL
jgi:hypothetical protein